MPIPSERALLHQAMGGDGAGAIYNDHRESEFPGRTGFFEVDRVHRAQMKRRSSTERMEPRMSL